MLLPADSMIAPEKLTKYLLVLLPKDDKSQFLQKAGYTLENWQQLEADLRSQVLTQPAIFMKETTYGSKYAIETTLRGVNGLEIEIITIWMVVSQQAKFVTLIPKSRRKQE
jgi:outer membrane receptor for Fe3+-dicitrate